MANRSEANISNSAAITVSRNGGKSFRNNVGGTWTGIKRHEYTENGKRYAIIENPRWITFGLIKGSADRIGWKSIVITADMVGKKFAQFLSLEMKAKNGIALDDQVNWHNVIINDGGLSGFARSDDDVKRIMNGERIDP